MHILRVIYDWPDENNITEGLAPAPYGLSLAQAKLGHKIYVLCGNLNKKNFLQGRFSYKIENGKIVVYNLPRALWKFGPFLTTSIFVLPYYFYIKLTKGIDVIHNQAHLGVWLLLYKFLFGWVDKTPVVGHIHITAKGREIQLLKQGENLGFMTKYFEYPIHKLSDYLTKYVAKKVVTVSLDNIDDLENLYGYKKDTVCLLETATDIHTFKKEGPVADLGFSKSDKILLNLGRLSKRKNIDVIVESLKHLPKEYKLALIGKWEDGFKKKVDNLIAKHKLEDRVKYLGSVSYFGVEKYYRAADIFLLPSSYEGLPKVIVETLACGTKAIASGFKTNQKIPNLYFLSKIDAKELANEIESVAQSPNKYKETYEVIEKYYSWDKAAKDLDEIYKEVSSK